MPNVSQELLPIVVQENQALIDARLLHQKLKSGAKFTDWIKTRITDYGFEQDKDYFRDFGKSSTKPLHQYLLTLDMAKELAMVERNDAGRAIRRYFIEKEKELRGIIHLSPISGLFKGLRPLIINNRELYPVKEIRERCGYTTKTSTYHYRSRYASHFLIHGDVLYCTKEFATHLHHQRQVSANRRALKQMQPVLPMNFGNMSLLQKGGVA